MTEESQIKIVTTVPKGLSPASVGIGYYGSPMEEIDISLDCEILWNQDICIIENNKLIRKARYRDRCNKNLESCIFHDLNTSSMTATIQRCPSGFLFYFY